MPSTTARGSARWATAARCCSPRRRPRWSSTIFPTVSRLQSLGEVAIADADRPQRLFQLEIEGLRTEFPALRARAAARARPNPGAARRARRRARDARRARRVGVRWRRPVRRRSSGTRASARRRSSARCGSRPSCAGWSAPGAGRRARARVLVRDRPPAVRVPPGGRLRPRSGASSRRLGRDRRPALRGAPASRRPLRGRRHVVRAAARAVLADREHRLRTARCCCSSTTCTGRTSRRCAGSATSSAGSRACRCSSPSRSGHLSRDSSRCCWPSSSPTRRRTLVAAEGAQPRSGRGARPQRALRRRRRGLLEGVLRGDRRQPAAAARAARRARERGACRRAPRTPAR